jgi:N-acetylglucosaminyldiphosphoundecaprenol N-acetyl-beta-D-mannosaminyltransferase
VTTAPDRPVLSAAPAGAAVATAAAIPTQAPAPAAAPVHPAAVRLPRRNILGAPVDLVDGETWVMTLRRWLEDGTPGTAIGVNANLVNLARRDPALSAAVHAADLAYSDGQAVVWASKLLGWPVAERLPTTDMVYPLCDMLADTGSSVFLFGGEQGVAADAAATLQERYPALVVAGYSHGYVPRDREDELIALINASGAQVLLVGMGDPVQQMWVARNRDKLRAKVVLTCGGLFNWVNGKQPRPPAWLISMGMEWAWRLAFEPRRLWKRYIVGNPQFMARLALALIKGERRPMQSKPTPASAEATATLVQIPRHRPELAADAGHPAPVAAPVAAPRKENSWN